MKLDMSMSQIGQNPVPDRLDPEKVRIALGLPTLAGAISASEGRKDDAGKAPWHLLAPELMDATAQVLEFGAKKYGARNWEKGMSWSRPFSAMMRHMWAWWRGEKSDPETGYSHLWHAACCLMFLIAYEQRQIGEDDRPEA